MIQIRDEIHRLFGEGTVAGLSDGQLLERFVSRGDGEAFAAIVARHGVMVLAACRAGLGTFEGAEDAFQATFLVLVRRAGSFPVQGSLAGWLYRVARRVARQARIEADRRINRERISAKGGEAEPARDHALDEIHRLIHEELSHLPERYRTAIQLCDLNGLTRDEAAEAIGCPPGTVAGRLARARNQLRGRLARRGVTSLSTWPIGLTGAIGHGSRLFQEATRAALAAARGETVASTAARLAAGVSRSHFLARIPATLARLVAVATTGLATAFLAFRTEGSPPPPPPIPPPPVQAPASPAQIPLPIDLNDPATADQIAGRVVDIAGKPIAGAKIYYVPHEHDQSPATEVRAVTTSDGRFRFSAKDFNYTALDGLPARRSGLLIATAEGCGPDLIATPGQASFNVRFAMNQNRTGVVGDEWTLTLMAGDVPIRGRLLDPQGQPLVGATVTLKMLSIPAYRDLDEFLGTINSPNRRPNYERIFEYPAFFPGVTTRAVTGADGRFKLEGLGRDRIAQLGIKGAGIVNASIKVMTREDHDFRVGGPNVGPDDDYIYGADFTYQNQPGRAISGVVVDQETGEPLAGVPLNHTLDWLSDKATDARGRFVFEGLSPKEKKITVCAKPKPGQPYLPVATQIKGEGELLLECSKGIPYRLTIRDETGRPVEAEVVYSVIKPNPFFAKKLGVLNRAHSGSPLVNAARQADGSYLGVAIPGPGVVTVKTRRGVSYRPAHVDPKGFFAPGRTEWTPQEMITTYGTHNTLSEETNYGGCWEDQHDFAAIVLINPVEDSKPLELAATVVPDRPRQVTLLDPDGKPVVGALARGLKYYSQYREDMETRLRAATFPLTGLHPARNRRIAFVMEDRRLIGFLMASGDGEAPYTVRMQPWATVIGRLVDEQGQPKGDNREEGMGPPPITLMDFGDLKGGTENDPSIGRFPYVEVPTDGRFRAEQLIPGQKYTAGVAHKIGEWGGTIFENITLAPGEVRDLGDITPRPKP